MAWALQADMVSRMREGLEEDTLLLLEHPHVFTLGKAAKPDHVLWDEVERARRGVEVISVDRGGEATYHGPGQLVGYPIVDLSRLGVGIRDYIERLERSLITYVAELGITSEPGLPGLTGVWSDGMKLAAVGIKLNRSIVSHGFALNLTSDLDYFTGIVPCGHAELHPTSVEALTGRRVATEAAARAYAPHFAHAFDVEVEWAAGGAASTRDSAASLVRR